MTTLLLVAVQCAASGAFAQPPEDVRRERERAEAFRRAGDPGRVVYTPTAFTRPEGDTVLNFFGAGTLTLEHGVTDDWTAGFQTTLPLGFVAVNVTTRAAFPFEWGALGVHAQAGFLYPFVGDDTWAGFLYGGGPMLTLGTSDHFVNLGVNAFGIGSTSSGAADVGLVAPTLGASVRASESIRINLELHTGAVLDGGRPKWLRGVLGLVGMRFFGDDWWVDVAVFQPLFQEYSRHNGLAILPLVPFINLGIDV